MRALPWLAGAMLLVQAGLMGYMREVYGAPGLVVAVGLAGLAWRGQWQGRALWAWLAAIAWGLLCLFYWQQDGAEDGGRAVIFGEGLGTTAILFLLGWQAGLCWRGAVRPPRYFPLLGVGVVSLLGDFIILRRGEVAVYGVAAAAFMVLAALFFDQHAMRGLRGVLPRGARLARLAILVVALALGGAFATALKASEDTLNRTFLQLVNEAPQRSVGFSQQASLNDVTSSKQRNAMQPALRIYSEQSPGYLRGAVYDRWQAGAWRTAGQSHNVPAQPAPARLDAPPDTPVYPLQQTEANRLRRGEVWPVVGLRRVLFLPQEAAFAAVRGTGLRRDALGAVSVRQPGAPPYIYWAAPPQAGVLGEAPPDGLLELPDDIGGRLQDLAARITAHTNTAPGKMAAVADYLRGRHDYALGYAPPPGADPLEHFLFSEPPPAAHCEYFATAATLLLRAAGVPARYVSGFLATERHPVDAYYVARQRDAHAWSEAWDPRTGWVTVEATPASGVPGDSAGIHPVRAMLESLGHRWQQWLALVQRQGIPAALWAALTAFSAGALELLTGAGLPVLLGLLLALVAWRLVRRRRGQRAPQRQGLPALLAHMDGWLAAQGIERAPGETLHAFAVRIEDAAQTNGQRTHASDGAAAQGHRVSAADAAAAAAWYRQYARVRYRDPHHPDAHRTLAEALPAPARE